MMSAHAAAAEQILTDLGWPNDPFASAQAHALLAMAAEQCTANKIAALNPSSGITLTAQQKQALLTDVLLDLGVTN